jgi:uncharacterized membrane protein (DUF373 family)
MVTMSEPRTASSASRDGTGADHDVGAADGRPDAARRASTTPRRAPHRRPKYTRIGNRLLEFSEDVVYVGIASLLLITALILLGIAVGEIFTLLRERSQEPALAVLDTLLLVFIVVELLFSVRATLARRALVAEPFLLVGIIASIKEIVVLSVKAADDAGRGQAFTDRLLEIAVLGALVLALGITAWLLRLKEREPEEGDEIADSDDAAD